MVYTNELHEALLQKNGNEFWKSKFEHYIGCKEVALMPILLLTNL